MQTPETAAPPWTRVPRAVLSSRYVPFVAAGASILLTLSSLTVGWVADDHYHRAALTGATVISSFVDSPMDMFMFFDGDAERTGRMIDVGFIPWWTYDGIKASLWRPLTVLTHWIDYKLWPEHAWLMHAHSIAWCAVAVALVAALYRRFMTPAWLAGLAALLYAIDDGHAMPVGFLANRNVLISVVFGVLAILAHDRWRRDAQRWGVVVAPACLLFSLLAKEAGIATCAYLFAYAVVFDRGRWRSRVLSLVPYFLIVAGWRAVYIGIGCGVAHAGLYVDPLHEPIRFVLGLPERVPVLLLGQFALPPAEISLVLDAFYARIHWLLAVVVVAALCVVFIPLLRHERVARFWLIGMLLALFPICTTFPADRLLLFVGIGAMGLVAQLIRAVLERTNGYRAGRIWRGTAVAVVAFLILVHGIVAPAALVVRANLPVGPRSFQRFSIILPPDPDIADQVLVVVNPPSVLHTAHFMVENQMRGRPVPRRARFLAPGMQSSTVYRPSADTLVIRPENGYLSWTFEQLFRNGAFPLSVGQRIELTGTTVEVTALTADGRPAEARFQFDVPLEDPSLYWMQWKGDRFVPFTPPGIGKQIDLVFSTSLF